MPRIIDIHTHGLEGCGTRGASTEEILEMARLHGLRGTGAILPAIFPARVSEMRSDIAAVKEAMGYQSEARAPGTSPAASILGVHLEGPFLNPSRAGALDREAFLSPSLDAWLRLVEGFEDVVKVVTIAPELQGAIPLIGAMSGMGIVVSMGHSDATYGEAEAGFKAGARGITHVFNAMRNFHHREPGIAGFALMNADVYVEVIADPYHLDVRAMELIFKTKDPGRIVVVSDTVKGSLSGGEGPVADGGGRLLGGSMPLPAAMRRLLELGFDGKAVERAAAENPARYLAMGQ